MSRALDHAPMRADWRRVDGTVEHVFTHFALTLTVYRAELTGESPPQDGARWVDEAALDDEALPTVFRKVMALARRD